MVVKGADILLYANTGTDQTPVYTKIGGQKNATLTEEAETIEGTSKTSPDGYKEYDYGYADWSIKCDGLYIDISPGTPDAGLAALTTAIREKKKLLVQVWESETVMWTGTCLVTSRELDAPDDDAATYSLELQGTGKPTYGASP